MKIKLLIVCLLLSSVMYTQYNPANSYFIGVGLDPKISFDEAYDDGTTAFNAQVRVGTGFFDGNDKLTEVYLITEYVDLKQSYFTSSLGVDREIFKINRTFTTLLGASVGYMLHSKVYEGWVAELIATTRINVTEWFHIDVSWTGRIRNDLNGDGYGNGRIILTLKTKK